MKRLHVSLSVKDIEESIRFYSAMFNTAPTTVREDYAQWMLDDPRVNFVIDRHCSQADSRPGVDHLGIQVESEEELDQVFDRFTAAEGPVSDLAEGTCCYAKSTKSWTADPQGVPWEAFHTSHRTEVYGTDLRLPDSVAKQVEQKTGCCE